MKTAIAFLILIFSAATVFAAHNSLTDAQLLAIKFDQRLNAQVSPDLTFRDESGRVVRFGDYLGKRPVVLVLGYYNCPMLCTLVLDGVTESFRDLKWSVGKQFDVVFVSIDPNEKSAVAAEKKQVYLRVYGRPGSEAGWHFLTAAGTPPPNGDMPTEDKSVQALADEIGFEFAYDPALKQYAHPSGFVVLTPGGKISHYFFGITFSPKEVDAALRGAGVNKIGSPVQEFILLCCEYSPLRGKYGNRVMGSGRAGGIVTLIGLGVLFFRGSRLKLQAPK
jgi:protein SCO1